MKIARSPIVVKSVSPNIQNTRLDSMVKTNLSSDFSTISAQNYRANFLSFGQIKKIPKPKHFSDEEKFPEYLENKIQRSLLVKDEEDIQNIVETVIDETGADKELVCETLSRLTQFSTYKSLGDLSSQLEDLGLKTFYQSFNYDSNYMMNYIAKYKNFISSNGNKHFYLADAYNLDALKNMHHFYKQRLTNKIKSNDLDFVIVDGWNARIDGKPQSYSIFGASNNLKNLTKNIVEEVQKTGKSLDEVFNGETIKIIRKEYGEDVPIHIIKNRNCKTNSISEICKNLEPHYPNAQEIRNFMNKLVQEFAKCDLTEGERAELAAENLESDVPFISNEEKYKLIATYLDTMLSCYSVESLNEELKKKYSAIERKVKSLGCSMADVKYVVLNINKSFGLITSQFARVNNIPDEQIKFFDGDNLPVGGIYVFLDDFSGSGHSYVQQALPYQDKCNLLNKAEEKEQTTNYIFAPIQSTKIAEDKVKKLIRFFGRENKDFLLSNKTIGYYKSLHDHLNNDEYKKLIRLNGSGGYGPTYSCSVFPYSFPDNNSNLASLFTSLFFPEDVISQKVHSVAHKDWKLPFDYIEFFNDKENGDEKK